MRETDNQEILCRSACPNTLGMELTITY